MTLNRFSSSFSEDPTPLPGAPPFVLSSNDPGIVRVPTHVDPIFVGADRLLGDDGRVDRSLYPSGRGAQIDLLLDRLGERGTLRLDVVDDARSVPKDGWTDLASLAAAVDGVLIASVESVHVGFHLGGVGSLATFGATEWLEDDAWPPPRCVVVPQGELTLGERRLVVRGRQWADTPRAGDRLLIFLEDNWYNRVSDVASVRAPQVVTLRADGSTSLPKLLRRAEPGLAATDAEALLSRVRAYRRRSSSIASP
ncbi:MAG: hypothetical protein AAGN46_01065 [Acidobacteriota bacterium]